VGNYRGKAIGTTSEAKEGSGCKYLESVGRDRVTLARISDRIGRITAAVKESASYTVP